ncbi:hypothetical protein PIB30_042442 [Stylosanthes scabra]|uniref:Uncharacterized protein n=1 Tax=Stylosanthes scabra TaxID=79078 RepID=A0ABU6SG38_9FABA|nr:hypothetical protein [Stylosanthes scabra]
MALARPRGELGHIRPKLPSSMAPPHPSYGEPARLAPPRIALARPHGELGHIRPKRPRSMAPPHPLLARPHSPRIRAMALHDSQKEVNGRKGEREARHTTHPEIPVIGEVTTRKSLIQGVPYSKRLQLSKEALLVLKEALFVRRIGDTFKMDDNLTSPAIPIDDGELALERTELGHTVIEVAPRTTTAQEHEADFNDESDSYESS